MNLDSFSIDQRIKVQDSIWRVKDKFKKNHFPWIMVDSVLLECVNDGTTTKLVEIIDTNELQLI